MAKTFKSGAFLRQCFDLHRQEIQCQKLAPPAAVLVLCKVCEIWSRISLPQEALGDDATQKFIAECVSLHPAKLRLQRMAIEAQELGFFCEVCRVGNRLIGLEFESTLDD